MIPFKDFIAKPVNAEGDLEPFEAILDRVDGWVHEHGVRAINLETVVLPNLERTSDTEICSDPKETYRYQFIRLGYDE